jgi:hypothetical protein
MRCKKAQDFIFSNCDELLNEAEKMQLLEHLEGCPSCARKASEIEACREMVASLPELSPSESFEWNLKRRIVQEKAKAGRGTGVTLFDGWGWGIKFAASAAAAIVIVFSGLWFFTNEPDTPAGSSGETRGVVTSAQRSGGTRYAGRSIPQQRYSNRMYPVGLQVVSQNNAGRSGSFGLYRDDMPIQSYLESRLDSLAQENEVLKMHLVRLERERNYYLRLLMQRNQNR